MLSSDIKQVGTNFSKSSLPFYRKLGRTDLTVSCLGLGGDGRISKEDTLYAFAQGINYFFYPGDRLFYSSMSEGLRQLCGRRSSVRDKVVLATMTDIKNPELALAALVEQFVELKIDYIDVFFWNCVGADDGPALQNCLQLSPTLRGSNSVYQRTIEKMFGTSELLKKMGVVRYIGASFHDVNLAQQWLHSSLLDVVMIEHNMTVQSAQSQVFTQLSTQVQRPGVITFNSPDYTDPLWNTPTVPAGYWRPSVPDLYRYSLTQNCVDVCLTGLTRRVEVDAAIAGVQRGNLSTAELDYFNLYGNLHCNN